LFSGRKERVKNEGLVFRDALGEKSKKIIPTGPLSKEGPIGRK